ncbi:MAG: hypothetical protein AVDCRST_MAG68-2677, partial [uncultured Gemmatimonadetes bacterium]
GDRPASAARAGELRARARRPPLGAGAAHLPLGDLCAPPAPGQGGRGLHGDGAAAGRGDADAVHHRLPGGEAAALPDDRGVPPSPVGAGVLGGADRDGGRLSARDPLGRAEVRAAHQGGAAGARGVAAAHDRPRGPAGEHHLLHLVRHGGDLPVRPGDGDGGGRGRVRHLQPVPGRPAPVHPLQRGALFADRPGDAGGDAGPALRRAAAGGVARAALAAAGGGAGVLHERHGGHGRGVADPVQQHPPPHHLHRADGGPGGALRILHRQRHPAAQGRDHHRQLRVPAGDGHVALHAALHLREPAPRGRRLRVHPLYPRGRGERAVPQAVHPLPAGAPERRAPRALPRPAGAGRRGAAHAHAGRPRHHRWRAGARTRVLGAGAAREAERQAFPPRLPLLHAPADGAARGHRLHPHRRDAGRRERAGGGRDPAHGRQHPPAAPAVRDPLLAL